MDIKGAHTVLIGAGGIGREIAVQLAGSGAKIVLADINDDTAKATAQAVEAAGGIAFPVHCDLGDPLSLDALARFVAQKLDHVDLLINHAGVSAAGVWEAIPDDAWRHVCGVNICGTAGSIARMLPLMRDGGHIVNTSSGLGLFHDLPFAAPYIASKAALIAMSRTLALYVRGRGIGVSVFCPDLTETAFVTSGKLYGIDPQIAAAGIPWDSMQTAASAATALLDGVTSGQFLISLVPDTAVRLALMAASGLAPGTDQLPKGTSANAILITAEIGLPEGNLRQPAIDALSSFAVTTRKEAGCIEYNLSIPVDDPNQLQLREIWESPAALTDHQAQPTTAAFLALASTLGFTSFTTRERALAL